MEKLVYEHSTPRARVSIIHTPAKLRPFRVAWRTPIMRASAFDYFRTRHQAETFARSILGIRP